MARKKGILNRIWSFFMEEDPEDDDDYDYYVEEPKPNKKQNKKKVASKKQHIVPITAPIVTKVRIQEEKKEKEIVRCEVKGCNNKLNYLSSQCPYCLKWHCSEHILPENHDCPNPQLPNYMRNQGTSVRYGQ